MAVIVQIVQRIKQAGCDVFRYHGDGGGGGWYGIDCCGLLLWVKVVGEEALVLVLVMVVVVVEVGVMETRCCCRTLSFSTVLVSMTM